VGDQIVPFDEISCNNFRQLAVIDQCGSVVPVNTMTEPGLDVAACVERVRQRDEDAARLLLNHLYPLVLKLVRAHLPQRSSDEDLTQIVFMKVFASLDRFSGTVPIEHWVSRIVINTCLNALKAEKIRPELRWADLSEEQCHVLETLGATTDELHPAHALAAREIVEKLLVRLSAGDRLLLTLLHLEDRSVDEVKQITGWNGTRIRVRAFRARQKLKKYFRELMPEEKP
jgi:RNA polymerase sigma-70 factor (ECF subfamily)